MPPIPRWEPFTLRGLLHSLQGESPTLAKRATFSNGRLPDRFIPLFIFIGFVIGCLVFIPWLLRVRKKRKELLVEIEDARSGVGIHRNSPPPPPPPPPPSHHSDRIRQLKQTLVQATSNALTSERVRVSQEEKIQLMETETRLLTETLNRREQENGILRQLLERTTEELSTTLARNGETLKNRAGLRRSLIHWQIISGDDETQDNPVDEPHNLQLPSVEEGELEDAMDDEELDEKTYTIYSQLMAPTTVDFITKRTVITTDLDKSPITQLTRRNTDPAEVPDKGRVFLIDTTTDIPTLHSEITKLRTQVAALTASLRFETTVSKCTDFRELELEHEAALSRLDEESLQLLTLQSQIHDLKETVSTLNGRIRSHQSRLKALEGRSEELTQINSERQLLLNTALDTQQTLKVENESLKFELSEKKRRLRTITSENSNRLLELARKNDRIVELEANIEALTNNGSEREAKITALTNDLQTSKVRLAFTLKQYYILTLTVSTLRTENENLNTQFNVERNLNITLQAETDSLKRKNSILSSSNVALRNSARPPGPSTTKSTSSLRPSTPPPIPSPSLTGASSYKPYRPPSSVSPTSTLSSFSWNSPSSTSKLSPSTTAPSQPTNLFTSTAASSTSPQPSSNPFASSSRPYGSRGEWNPFVPRLNIILSNPETEELDIMRRVDGVKERVSLLVNPHPSRSNTTSSANGDNRRGGGNSPLRQLPTIPPPPPPGAQISAARQEPMVRSPLRLSSTAGGHGS